MTNWEKQLDSMVESDHFSKDSFDDLGVAYAAETGDESLLGDSRAWRVMFQPIVSGYITLVGVGSLSCSEFVSTQRSHSYPYNGLGRSSSSAWSKTMNRKIISSRSSSIVGSRSRSSQFFRARSKSMGRRKEYPQIIIDPVGSICGIRD